MGYDLYLERSAMTPADHAAKEQAEVDFDAACKERDALDRTDEQRAVAQRKVTAAYERLYGEANKDYYRLNIWGMSTMCKVMDTLGMLHDTKHPKFPDLPDLGATDEYEIMYALRGNDTGALALFTPEEVTTMRTYMDEAEKVRSYVVGDTPGIMSFKFGSNDDWLVTPAECKSAVIKWNETGQDERESIVWSVCGRESFDSKVESVEWVTRWVVWLDRASRHGGFRVR